LLLTDMIMPDGVSGAELAQRLQAGQPHLKIIFTSGYTANEVSPEMLAKTPRALPPETLHARHARQSRPRHAG